MRNLSPSLVTATCAHVSAVSTAAAVSAMPPAQAPSTIPRQDSRPSLLTNRVSFGAPPARNTCCHGFPASAGLIHMTTLNTPSANISDVKVSDAWINTRLLSKAIPSPSPPGTASTSPSTVPSFPSPDRSGTVSPSTLSKEYWTTSSADATDTTNIRRKPPNSALVSRRIIRKLRVGRGLWKRARYRATVTRRIGLYWSDGVLV